MCAKKLTLFSFHKCFDFRNVVGCAINICKIINIRSAADAELLNKIDMLFLYFFHQSSYGATIDANHQIQFLYGNP